MEVVEEVGTAQQETIEIHESERETEEKKREEKNNYRINVLAHGQSYQEPDLGSDIDTSKRTRNISTDSNKPRIRKIFESHRKIRVPDIDLL